jgi:SAM-dependent methyltransferase
VSERIPGRSWATHPLADALRCVRCLSATPLVFDEPPAGSAWVCRACGARFDHWEEMPVILAEEMIRPEEVYADAPPGPLGQLRSRVPWLFRTLRAAYAAYVRFEGALMPPRDLEPLLHLKRMKAALPRIPSRLTLDVGGGAAPYRTTLDGSDDSWIVLEKDRFFAREMRGKGAGADYLVGGAERIPVQSARCDLVVLTEVLEHCTRPAEVVKDIARVLKPGGFCIGTAPQYWHVHAWPSDYFRYTLHGLELLASEAGLRVVRMEPRGGPFQLLWLVMDLTTCRWSRLPGVSLLVRVPTLWAAWLLDRLFYRDPKRMAYPDTAGWAFLFEKPV